MGNRLQVPSDPKRRKKPKLEFTVADNQPTRLPDIEDAFVLGDRTQARKQLTETIRPPTVSKELERTIRGEFSINRNPETGFIAAGGDKAAFYFVAQNLLGISKAEAEDVFNLARSQNLPSDYVARNLPEIKNQIRAEALLEMFSTKTPGGDLTFPAISEFLLDSTHPENMAIFQDQAGALAVLEAHMLSFDGPAWITIPYNLIVEAQNVLRSALTTSFLISTSDWYRLHMQTRVNTARMLHGDNVVGESTPVTDISEPIRAEFFDGSAEQEKLRAKDEAEIWEMIRTTKALNWVPLTRRKGTNQFMHDVTGIITQLGGAMIANTLLPFLGGPLFISSHIFGTTFEELDKAGVEKKRAIRAAAANAIIQMPLEMIGLRRLTKLWQTRGAIDVVKQWMFSLGTEVGTEFAQSVLGESPTSIYGRADLEGGMSSKQIFDKWFKDLPESSKQGLYEGFVVAVAALGLGGRGILSKSIRAEQHLQWWKKFVKLNDAIAKNSGASPQAMGNLIGAITDEHGNSIETSIHVSADTIHELFQEGNEIAPADEVFERLGISKKQQEESLATGTDIPVSYKQYFEGVAGTDIGITLDNDIRLAPDEPTAREMQKALAEATETARQVEADLVATMLEEKRTLGQMPPEIKEMRKLLRLRKSKGGFGLNSDAADAHLGVFLAGAARLSRLRSETMEAWMTRVGPLLRIGGTAKAEAQKQPARGKGPRATTFLETTEGRLRRIIQLFEGADKSSFAHEMAHIFILDMEDALLSGIVTDPALKTELQTNFDTLVKFGGSLGADGKLTLAGQEKIARAFERYLQTGKAPSLRLTKAFEAFRKWLTAIYGYLTAHDAKLNDQIKDAFDSMLASEMDIAEATVFYGAKASNIIKNLPDVTEKEKEKLQQLEVNVEQSAITKQVTKMYSAFLGIEGNREKIQQDAEEAISRQRVYHLIDAIKADKGVAIQDVLSIYGQSIIDEINGKHGRIITAKGKADLTALSQEFKFENGNDELINELRTATRKSTAVKEKIKQIKDEAKIAFRKGLQREGTLTGDEAITDEQALLFYMTEAAMLAKRVKNKGRQRFTKAQREALNATVKDILTKKSVKDATSWHAFARASQRNAKAALKAMEKGDFNEALRLKDQQIFNHIMTMEAIKLKKQIEKIERRYGKKKLKTSLSNTNIEDTFKEAILAIVNGFGLTGKGIQHVLQKDIVKNFDELWEKDPFLAETIPPWVVSQARVGYTYEDKQSWRTELTTGEFLDLAESIQAIQLAGSGALRKILDDRWRTLEAVKDASVLSMSVLEDKKVMSAQKGVNQDQRTWLDHLDGVLAKGAIVSFPWRRADGDLEERGIFQPGPLMTYIRGLRAAEGEFKSVQKKTFEATNASWKTLESFRKRIKEERGKLFDIEGVPVTEAQRAAGRLDWSADQIIAVVMNMGSVTNIQALMGGYDYSLKQLNTIAALMNDSELDAIQNIWDVTDTLFEAYDATFFALQNRHLTRIPAESITITRKDGTTKTLRGGYHHLDYDPEISSFVAKFNEKDRAKNDYIHAVKGAANNVRSYLPPRDATKERSDRPKKLPPKLSTTVWMKHINDVARFTSHAQIMTDLNKLTLNEEWATMFKRKFGRNMYHEVREWVRYQALPERRIPSGFFGKTLEGQRERATVAFLGWKLAVGLKQRLSMTGAISQVGAGAIIQAAQEMGWRNMVYGSKGSQQWDQILALSSYMRIRARAFDRDLIPTLRAIRPRRGITVLGKEFTGQDITDFAFEWIQLNDRATVGVVWTAGFNRAYESFENDPNMTDQQKVQAAVNSADSLVENTQPSALPLDLSGFQREEGFIRLFTLFQTWQTKAGNRYVANFRLWKDGRITGKEYWRRFLYEAIAAPWIGAIIGSLVRGWELPEWWELAFAPLESSIGWIPFIREVPSVFKYNRGFGESVVFEGGARFIKTIESAENVIRGKGEMDDLIWNLARAMEFQVKFPATNVIAEVQRALRNFEEAKKK